MKFQRTVHVYEHDALLLPPPRGQGCRGHDHIEIPLLLLQRGKKVRGGRGLKWKF